MDRCKWRKMIKEARWFGWVWVGESSFWYRPTRVVPDQRPLNGRVRRVHTYVCSCVSKSSNRWTRWSKKTDRYILHKNRFFFFICDEFVGLVYVELHLHIRLVRNSAKIFSRGILSRPFRPLPPVFRPPCLHVLPAVKQRVHELRAVCLSVYRICPRDLPKSGRILTALKWVRLPTRNCWFWFWHRSPKLGLCATVVFIPMNTSETLSDVRAMSALFYRARIASQTREFRNLLALK